MDARAWLGAYAWGMGLGPVQQVRQAPAYKPLGFYLLILNVGAFRWRFFSIIPMDSVALVSSLGGPQGAPQPTPCLAFKPTFTPIPPSHTPPGMVTLSPCRLPFVLLQAGLAAYVSLVLSLSALCLPGETGPR